MNFKSILMSLSAEMIRAVNRTEDALPQDALEGPSSWEVWNAADAVTHCAAWLEKDRRRLDNPDEMIPIISDEELVEINRHIYETHQGTAWANAKEKLEHTRARITARLDSMSEDELRATLKYSDCRQRPLWWSPAGHLGLHVAWHLGIILNRHGSADLSVTIAEDIVSISKTLGDDPKWLSANSYDLAVSYARAGRLLEALGELKASLSFNPAVRDFAKQDEELQILWDREDFRRLTG
jgi:hypothetical protein